MPRPRCKPAVVGPVAALLIERPARIRYTGLSVPCHLGAGWFGGLTPAAAFALAAWQGGIYFGPWSPAAAAVATAGASAIPDRRNADLSPQGAWPCWTAPTRRSPR